MPKRKRFGNDGGAGAPPKNSSTAKGRSNDASANTQGRTAATARRLKMYNSRAKRDKNGRLISQELQSKELPSTRIVPDRRWFGNTRTVGQAQLERFREEVGAKVDDPYSVLLKERKLPLGLLNDKAKHKRVHLVDTEPFESVFGKGATRKRPKLAMGDYEALADAASKAAGGGAVGGVNIVGERLVNPSVDAALAKAEEGHGRYYRAKMFDKGQSGRIWGELYKVIDSSDVVIQVIDARDPEGTRCRHLEAHLQKEHKHKHLILLLNKCDLVPAWVARRWLAALSKEYPTLAFHASSGRPFGKGALLGLLRQLARLKSDKQSISVGMVGYPNVGKSSVINTLRDKKVCPTAPVPGETKVWRYVSLMRRINLIDCPGVVYDKESNSEGESVLKGVTRIDRLEDATEYVPLMLTRVKRQYIQKAYKLKSWLDAEDFLAQVAQNSGKMLPGGEADLNTAARMVLTDWQRGRLPYFTPPPAAPEGDDAKPPPLIASKGRTINSAPAEEEEDAPEGKGKGKSKDDLEVAPMPEINQPLGKLRPVEGFFDDEDERADLDGSADEDASEGGGEDDEGAEGSGSEEDGDDDDDDDNWDALMQSVGVRKVAKDATKAEVKAAKAAKLDGFDGEGKTGLEAYDDYSDGEEREREDKRAAKRERRMKKRRRQGLLN